MMSGNSKAIFHAILNCLDAHVPIVPQTQVDFVLKKDIDLIQLYFDLNRRIKRNKEFLEINGDFMMFQIDCHLASPLENMRFLDRINFYTLRDSSYYNFFVEQIKKKNEIQVWEAELSQIESQLSHRALEGGVK